MWIFDLWGKKKDDSKTPRQIYDDDGEQIGEYELLEGIKTTFIPRSEKELEILKQGLCSFAGVKYATIYCRYCGTTEGVIHHPAYNTLSFDRRMVSVCQSVKCKGIYARTKGRLQRKEFTDSERILLIMSTNTAKAWTHPEFMRSPYFIGYSITARMSWNNKRGYVESVGKSGRYMGHRITTAGIEYINRVTKELLKNNEAKPTRTASVNKK